jgi:hypothetical protein
MTDSSKGCKKVLSFSVWGSNPKYTLGFLVNARLAEVLYPGWEVWCFCDRVAFEVISSNVKAANKVHRNIRYIVKAEKGDWRGMFWRFLPIYDSEVYVFVSRDADSRLSLRERLAVRDWEDSGKAFHIMRDHPFHKVPILGGMWGCRPLNTLSLGVQMPQQLDYLGSYWQIDQEYLASAVYPLIEKDVMIHDPFFSRFEFPVGRVGDEFVGEAFEIDGARDLAAVNALNAWLDIDRKRCIDPTL